MIIRRKTSEEDGMTAVRQVRDLFAPLKDTAAEGIFLPENIEQAFSALPRSVRATFVRFSLEELATLAPGNSVEVRVPPLGVIQCVAGPRHTRGTPPSVVETSPAVWAALILGACTWKQASSAGILHASGERSNLSSILPLF